MLITMRKALLAVFVAALLSTPAKGQAGSPSAAERPELSRLLSIMSESASDGPSLAFFGFMEDERIPEVGPSAKCRIAGAKEAVLEFQGIVDETINGGSGHKMREAAFAQLRAEAIKELTELVGAGSYRICRYSDKGHLTAGHVTVFTGSDYAFATELGYED